MGNASIFAEGAGNVLGNAFIFALGAGNVSRNALIFALGPVLYWEMLSFWLSEPGIISGMLSFLLWAS